MINLNAAKDASSEVRRLEAKKAEMIETRNAAIAASLADGFPAMEIALACKLSLATVSRIDRESAK